MAANYNEFPHVTTPNNLSKNLLEVINLGRKIINLSFITAHNGCHNSVLHNKKS